MRTGSCASSQSFHSVDAEAWCKRALVWVPQIVYNRGMGDWRCGRVRTGQSKSKSNVWFWMVKSLEPLLCLVTGLKIEAKNQDILHFWTATIPTALLELWVWRYPSPPHYYSCRFGGTDSDQADSCYLTHTKTFKCNFSSSLSMCWMFTLWIFNFQFLLYPASVIGLIIKTAY